MEKEIIFLSGDYLILLQTASIFCISPGFSSVLNRFLFRLEKTFLNHLFVSTINFTWLKRDHHFFKIFLNANPSGLVFLSPVSASLSFCSLTSRRCADTGEVLEMCQRRPPLKWSLFYLILCSGATFSIHLTLSFPFWAFFVFCFKPTSAAQFSLLLEFTHIQALWASCGRCGTWVMQAIAGERVKRRLCQQPSALTHLSLRSPQPKHTFGSSQGKAREFPWGIYKGV